MKKQSKRERKASFVKSLRSRDDKAAVEFLTVDGNSVKGDLDKIAVALALRSQQLQNARRFGRVEAILTMKQHKWMKNDTFGRDSMIETKETRRLLKSAHKFATKWGIWNTDL